MGGAGGGAGGGQGAGGWAIVVRAAAEDADLVVEAHLKFASLVFVLAHQSKVDVALHDLSDVLDGNLGVVLRPALDFLWMLTAFLAGGADVLVGFEVSLAGPRGGVVDVEPFAPGAQFGFTGGSGVGGGGGHAGGGWGRCRRGGA